MRLITALPHCVVWLACVLAEIAMLGFGFTVLAPLHWLTGQRLAVFGRIFNALEQVAYRLDVPRERASAKIKAMKVTP